MEDTLLKWAMGLGFPAVVAGFCLVRLEKRLEELRDAVRDLVVHMKSESKRIPEVK